MADIIQYHAPERQKNVFYVDIDVPVFQKGTFGFVAYPDDAERLKLCPIFQSILDQTTPLYEKERYALRQIELKPLPKEDGIGTRLKMTSNFALTEQQQAQIYYAVDNHLQSETLIFDEDAFIADTKAKQRDFSIDESLRDKNPALYAAQGALFDALELIIPGVRKDKGDIQVINIDQKNNEFSIDVVAIGSCNGCGSGGTMTVKKLYEDTSYGFSLPQVSAFLKETGSRWTGINLTSINVYGENSLNFPSYTVKEGGVFSPSGKEMYSFKPALSPK